MKNIFCFFIAMSALIFSACNTKSDIRREQELERLKAEVNTSRSDKADLSASVDEVRGEAAKLHSAIEEQTQARLRDSEEFKKEIMVLTARVQALEQKIVAEESRTREVKTKASYEAVKKLHEEKKYDEAVEMAREVIHVNPKGEEGKKTQFLMAQSLYSNQDYASAALEFGEYKKSFPKDALVPEATYHQAQAFKSMGKKSEARLFFQEVIEKFPKTAFAAKAKSDLKKLK